MPNKLEKTYEHFPLDEATKENFKIMQYAIEYKHRPYWGLYHVKLNGADLTEANLTGAKFLDSTLVRANLRRACLVNIQISICREKDYIEKLQWKHRKICFEDNTFFNSNSVRNPAVVLTHLYSQLYCFLEKPNQQIFSITVAKDLAMKMSELNETDEQKTKIIDSIIDYPIFTHSKIQSYINYTLNFFNMRMPATESQSILLEPGNILVNPQKENSFRQSI